MELEKEELKSSNSEHVIRSMAISLKRIADTLEKLTKVPVMNEMTPEQEEEWEKINRHMGFVSYKR